MPYTEPHRRLAGGEKFPLHVKIVGWIAIGLGAVLAVGLVRIVWAIGDAALRWAGSL